LHRSSASSGKGDKRLTDPKFNHSISLSPDRKYFIDTYQRTMPAGHRLVDSEGSIITELSGK